VGPDLAGGAANILNKIADRMEANLEMLAVAEARQSVTRT